MGEIAAAVGPDELVLYRVCCAEMLLVAGDPDGLLALGEKVNVENPEGCCGGGGRL